jgi:hypothetical protein
MGLQLDLDRFGVFLGRCGRTWDRGLAAPIGEIAPSFEEHAES